MFDRVRVTATFSTLAHYSTNLIGNFKYSVIRQKGESQNGCFKKTNHVKFSEKTNIFYPLIRTHTWVFTGRECVSQITQIDPTFKVVEMLQKSKLIIISKYVFIQSK